MTGEADKVREALADDPFVSNDDYGRLVAEAEEADERASWAQECPRPRCSRCGGTGDFMPDTMAERACSRCGGTGDEPPDDDEGPLGLAAFYSMRFR